MRNKQQLFGKLFHPAKIQTYKKLFSKVLVIFAACIIGLIGAAITSLILITTIVNTIEAYTGKTMDQITVEIDPDLLNGKKWDEEIRQLHNQ